MSSINPIDHLGQHRSLDLFLALPIFELGLIDEVLAPASTNKRPVPEWQCHTAKAKSSASTPTDMHVNERTVGRSGGLFVWVVGMGETKPSRGSPVLCLPESKRELGYADGIVQNV